MSDAHRHDWEARHRRGATAGPPSPFVVTALDLIARRHAPPDDTRRHPRANDPTSHAATGGVPRAATSGVPRALDVACGAGRHALLLAARGYRVVALDFARPALLALRAAAAQIATDERIDVLAADATSWPLQPASFAVVLVVDFLERALFADLRTAVVPGGALVMETFMAGQERYGHPRNPAYLLRPGELRDACRGWTILLAHEGETTGTAAACRAGIVAVRPRDVDTTDPFGSYPHR